MKNQNQDILKQSGFKCKKCGYYDPLGKSLQVNNQNNNTVLCSICNHHAPKGEKDFQTYINEKIDWQALESFRKFHGNIGENLKQGMLNTARKGRIVSRPAFGYNILNSELIPAENSDEVREIFQSFLDKKSLHQISREHNMSVNGIKKILHNFTYIGKVKFNNEIMNGNHQPIITSELFNSVQNRFEKLKQK